MPSIVKTENPKYTSMADKWSRARDTVSGNDAVKAAGRKYLPSLKDSTEEDYQSYKTRASWFGAVWRTISALSGMIFRKEPQLDLLNGYGIIKA